MVTVPFARTVLPAATAIKPQTSPVAAEKVVSIEINQQTFIQILIDQNFIERKSCEDSWYGCCPDGKNIAQGPNFSGCPSLCGCNKLGSYSEVCDPETKQCRCRPGVGGAKCDRCEPGYWGLPKISSGYRGCIRKIYFFNLLG